MLVQIYMCIVFKGSRIKQHIFNLLGTGHLQIPGLPTLENRNLFIWWLNPSRTFGSLTEENGWIWENGHLSLLFCRILKSGESWISLPCRNHLTCKGGAPRTRHSRTTTCPSEVAVSCSSWNPRRHCHETLRCSHDFTTEKKTSKS